MRKKPLFKIVPGKPYSLTVNPTYFQMNSRTTPGLRCSSFLTSIGNYIQAAVDDETVDSGIYLQVYPDISQPLTIVGNNSATGGGRMHVHGWVLFRDWSSIRYWFMHALPCLTHGPRGQKLHSASIEMDTIDSIPTWVEYCKKSQASMWPTGDYFSNIPDNINDIIMDYTDPSVFAPPVP